MLETSFAAAVLIDTIDLCEDVNPLVGLGPSASLPEKVQSALRRRIMMDDGLGGGAFGIRSRTNPSAWAQEHRCSRLEEPVAEAVGSAIDEATVISFHS